MADEQEQAILPVEQDTVPFYDRRIIAAQFARWTYSGTVGTMCDVLQLEREGR